jgi:cyclic-di-GMP-binding protein
MLESSTILGKGKPNADALANAEAAEKFWDSLPRRDPMEMQRRLCDELAKGAGWNKLDIERFRALRALDRRAGRLMEGVVAEYASLGGQLPVVEGQLWRAALEMSRSFAHDFERFLRVIRTGAAGSAWQERTPELLVRLLQHREIELLLSLFRYEKWPRGRWKSLHDAYRFATAKGIATRAVVIGQRADSSVITVTPEQVYVRILLLQLLDGGQFRSAEIARTRRAILSWSKNLGLQKLHALLPGDEPQNGFIVDLAGAEGLTRVSKTTTGDLLWLDTTPIANSINTAIAERGNGAASAATTNQQVGEPRLLGKLQFLYAPQPQKIKRRGERTAVALMSVEATLGDLQIIFRMLREEARRAIVAATVPMPYADEITITDVDSMRAARGSGGSDVLHSTWHVRDRSDSGCLLRGRVSDARRLLPGLLIAFREAKVGPWTVAVVRRLNRLMGNNVEIGVEHIGRNPQRIILLSGPSAPEIALTSETQPARFVALYLPESDAYPKMPIKTLLVPACEFVPGRVVTMLSTIKEVVIRLKEPLEHQADFVWTSFEPLDSGASVDSAANAVP